MNALLISVAWLLAGADAAPHEQQADEVRQKVPGFVDTVFLGADRPIFLRFHVKLDDRSQRDVWLEHVSESFRQFDRDKSGGLTGAELSKVPWVGPSLGKTDSEALGQLLRKHGVRNETRDDEVTQVELVKLAMQLNPMFRITSNDARQDAERQLFSYLDTDENEQLTSDELDERAMLSLWSTDLNDDEAITVPELMQATGSAPGGLAVVRSDGAGRVVRAGTATILFDLTDSRDLRRASNAMHEKFCMLQRVKTDEGSTPRRDDPAIDSPSFFTNEMLQLSVAAFDRADSDANHLLDAEEMAAYLAEPMPDVELKIDLSENSSSQPDIKLVASPDARHLSDISVTKRSDGSLVLKIGRTYFEFTAANINFERNAAIYVQQFAAADGDKNEYLDSQEVQQNGFFQRTFSTMDVDGDGKIFADEMKRWLEQQQATAASRTVLTLSRDSQPLFQLLDVNSDGRLTARELKQRTTQIARHDDNQDGALTINELPQRFRMFFRQDEPTSGVNAFALLTTPTDTASAQSEHVGPRWFRRMDRNNDNDVSRREFLGPLAIFNKLDANGDDLIDPVEAEQANKH